MRARIALVTLLALVFAAPAQATHGPNSFSGSWATNLGGVGFSVTSEANGASGLQSLGGYPCGAPTVYYEGFYYDEYNRGGLFACTQSRGHLVGRYVAEGSSSSHGDGGIDLNFVAPNSFSGHYTGDNYPGRTFTYTGSFAGHLDGDGCCPGTAPPPGETPPSGEPTAETPPPVLPAATAWDQPGPTTTLAAGGEAIARSPLIGRDQREASLTVSGDAEGKTVIAAQTNGKGRLRDCIQTFVNDAEWRKVQTFDANGTFVGEREVLVEDGDEFFIHIVSLLGCIEEVKQAHQLAKSSLAPSAEAAQSGCRTRAGRIKATFNRTSRTVTYQDLRRPRRSPSRRLRVSCRKEADGAVRLRIRTRSSRTKLRKLLGPRLVVALYRGSDATGTADVQTTFNRP